MNIIENGLYSYAAGRGHCKHGLVIIKRDKEENLYAEDTYWSSGGTRYNLDDVKGELEFLLDLNNVKEVSKDDYDLYDPKDRAYIPVGGWHEKRLVRADATKRTALIIEDLEYRISKNKSEIKALQWDVERMEKDLENYKEVRV